MPNPTAEPAITLFPAEHHVGAREEQAGVSHSAAAGHANRNGLGKLNGFKPWLARSFWAVLDQGLFALSNFALNILLARWLSPQDYGAFTVGFTIFLLLGTIHTALLTEPMLVFGPGKFKDRFSEYLGLLIYGHSGITLLGSVLLLLTGLGFVLYGSREVAYALFGLALSAPFMLFLWLMRRACYVRLQPCLAAFAGGIYMILMLTGSYLLYRFGWLSSVTALIVMGLASLGAGIWLIAVQQIQRPTRKGNSLPNQILKTHWRYGRWAVSSSALSWVPGNICFLLLPLWWGLEASAALKAMFNLLLPILHMNAALSVLLVPTFVRAHGKAKLESKVRLASLAFVAGGFVYWILLGLFHTPVLRFLYAGQYTEHARLLWFLGLLPLSAGIVAVLGGALRAIERPNQVFWCYVASSVVALSLAIWLVMFRGVEGAAVALLASSLTTAGTMAWFYHARNRVVMRVV